MESYLIKSTRVTIESGRILPPPHTPDDLREGLEKGLFVDAEHLRGMVKISADLSLDTSCPTLFRNINGVLSKLLRDWEEGPLTAERASQIDGRLRAPLMELVDGAINGANRDTLLALLDSLSSEVFLLNDPTLNEP